MISPLAKVSPSAIISASAIIAEFTTIKEHVTIEENTIIGPLNVIEAYATIGKNCTIQPHCVIARNMRIGKNVFIGPHFSCSNDPTIANKEHGTSPNKKLFEEYPPTIKDGVRVGTRVTLAPNVTLNEDCFVKMNSFIKSDVPKGKTIPPGIVFDNRDL